MITTHFALFSFFNGMSNRNAPPPAVVNTPNVGNNTFWRKGYRQIGQTRKWRYWWEQDPTQVPKVIPVPETIEEIREEIEAVTSHITELTIERAAANSLAIMRAYAEILQEQVIAKQQAEVILEAKVKKEKILRRKKMMLLLS